LKYRAEIDGLRALAVVPVIFFHAGFKLFNGGFVGVDMFFVISGYLITTILIENIENKQFSIVNFYERRARRILPALFFVILACIPFAWMWMLPSQMKDFAQSLVAVSFFASNILFWRESGYFDAVAEEKPLLHTWSLAVEEQYYIFFPIFLILFWRFGKGRVFWVIVVMASISLLLSEWGWRKQPTANFYFILTRAWELFAGSIAAFIVQKRGIQKDDFLSLLGLLAIVFSIFAYNESTPFPSLYALVPVLGVVLIILYADKDTLVAKLLSKKAFVYVGLISYSAYLWHQPFFAFARIKTLGEPSTVLMITLCLLSIVAAFITWRYVERPFRSKSIVSGKVIFLSSFAGIVITIFIGVVIPKTETIRFNNAQLAVIEDGRKNRLLFEGSAYDRFECFFDYKQKASQLLDKKCITDSTSSRIILFGDSEAAHLLEGMKSVFKKHEIMQFTGTSCRAIDYESNSNRCKEFYNLFVTEIVPNLTAKDIVVVSSNWWNTFRDIGEREFSSSLKDILLKIKKSQVNLFVFTNAPGFNANPYETLAVMFGGNVDKITLLETQNIWDSDFVIEAIANEINVKTFNVSKVLCIDAGKCLFRNLDNYLYFDTGHLSFYGSRYVANEFRKANFSSSDESENKRTPVNLSPSQL